MQLRLLESTPSTNRIQSSVSGHNFEKGSQEIKVEITRVTPASNAIEHIGQRVYWIAQNLSCQSGRLTNIRYAIPSWVIMHSTLNWHRSAETGR